MAQKYDWPLLSNRFGTFSKWNSMQRENITICCGNIVRFYWVIVTIDQLWLEK